MTEVGSAAAVLDPVRSDQREVWWLWHWDLASWSSLAGTSSSGLFPLCSLCTPWPRTAWSDMTQSHQNNAKRLRIQIMTQLDGT